MADRYTLSDVVEQPLSPPEPRLEQDMLNRQAQETMGDQDTTWDVFTASVEADSITSDLMNLMRSDPVELQAAASHTDPDFSLDTLDEVQKATLFDGLPEHMYDVYEDAVSYEHALAMKKYNVDVRLKAEQVLNRQGIGTQLAIRGLVSVLDPVALGATIASEGALAPLIWGAKISRMGSILRGGAVAMGTNAALESALYFNDPMRKPEDILYAGALGFTLGAPLAGIVQPAMVRSSVRKFADEAQRRGNGEAPTHVPQLDEDGLDYIAPPDADTHNDVPNLDMEDVPPTIAEPEVKAEPSPVVATPEGATIAEPEVPLTWKGSKGTHQADGYTIQKKDGEWEIHTGTADEVSDSNLIETVGSLKGAKSRVEVLRQRKAEPSPEVEPVVATPKGDAPEVDINQADIEAEAVVTGEAVKETKATLTAHNKELGKAKRALTNSRLAAEKSPLKWVKDKTDPDGLYRADGYFIVKAVDVDGKPTGEWRVVQGDDVLDQSGWMDTVKTLKAGKEIVEKARRTNPELEAKIKELEAKKATLKEASQAAEQADKDVKAKLSGFDVKDPNKASTERYNIAKKAVGGAKAWASKIRVSMGSTLMSSDHAIINHVGRKLVPDGVGRDTLGQGQSSTAQEIGARFYQTLLTKYASASDAGFRAWRKATGRSRFGFKARQEYEEAVTKAIRAGGSDDPHIAKAAQALQGMYREFAELLRDSGVKGFEELMPSSNYVPRLFNFNEVGAIHDTIGTGNLELLIAQAIKNATKGLDEDDVAKVAKKYVETLRRVRTGESTLNHVQLTELQFETLKEMVEGEISDKALNAILSGIKTGTGEGVVSRAKKRLVLDETATIKVNGVDYSFQDLLMNNAFDVANMYAHQMSGQIGLARVGIKSRADWAKLMSDIDNTKHLSGLDEADIANQKEMLDIIYRSITGAPLHKKGMTSEMLQLIRDYNYARVMNQTGWAQLPEIFNAMGEHGIITFMKAIPTFGRIIRNAKTGTFNDEFMAELDSIWAFGNDPIIRRASSRHSEPSEGVAVDSRGVRIPFTQKRVGNMEGIHRTLKAAGKVTSTLSGMAPITTSFERMTAIMIVKNFADMAKGSSKYTMERLAAMGINDKNSLESILTQLRTHSGTVEGPLSGRTINALNIDKWDDIEAREAFITAVQRATHRSIQRNNVGDMAKWMTTDLGQTAMQFRSFVFGAYEKQTLRGFNQHDSAMALQFIMTTMVAAMAYTGQTYVKSIGRKDQKEYLDRMLSPLAIAKSGFLRSGWASLLPAMWDAGADFIVDPPHAWMFGYARSSGQASHIVEGIPTVGMFTAAKKSAHALVESGLTSRELTQKDIRTLGSLMLFQNLHPVQWVINAAASQFPERQSTLK